MKPEESQAPRRWSQFSLKAILILTLVVAAYFAGRIPEQRRALQAEHQLRDQARQAAQVAENARQMAERSQAQANRALQQARTSLAQMALERARRANPAKRENEP